MHRIALFFAACIACLGGRSSCAQTAYFSLEGDFANGAELHDFFFDLSRSVSSAEDLRFQTFANSGGTNAALESVSAGGIDSLLELFDSGGLSRGINDDADAGASLDSLLSWPGVAPNPGPINTSLNPDPILAGGYRLQMSEFGAATAGPWALDLVGPADALALTGAAATGASTIDTLKFGTTGLGTTPASYTQSGGSLSILGDLVTAQSGLGLITISAGGHVTNATGRVGVQAGSAGGVSVVGTSAGGDASTWTNNGELILGQAGTGILEVSNGGAVTSGIARVGFLGTGTAIVAGINANGNASSWTTSGDLVVGDGATGDGTLSITAGGQVTSPCANIGNGPGSTGEVVVRNFDDLGNASTWTINGELLIGFSGSGRLLVGPNAQVSAASVEIASQLGSSGSLEVFGVDSQLVSTGGMTVAKTTTGALDIGGGGRVSSGGAVVGDLAGSVGTATVTGADTNGNASTWTNSGVLVLGSGGDGTLNVQAGGRVSNTDGFIGDLSGSMGLATVTGTDVSGAASSWTNSGNLTVGHAGSGTLNVEAGGRVDNVFGEIARFPGSTGVATVAGIDANGNPSTWTNTNFLNVGFSGNATLNVSAGGQVSNTVGTIASEVGSTGVATVAGTDANGNASTWTNSGVLFIGFDGDGTLSVQAGGRVSNTDGFIGVAFGSTGVATVTGTDASGGASTWANSGSLIVGNGGSGTLNILGGGLVTVGGATGVTPFGTVNLGGGRFEFGAMSAIDLARINGVSGELAGSLVAALTGSNDIAGLDDASLQTLGFRFDRTIYPNLAPAVDVSGVFGGGNDGFLFGAGASPYSLKNNPTGEVEVITGERMSFAGATNTNAGQITLAGGQVQFGRDFLNDTTGLVIGDGGLRVDGGVINDGTMAFSATARVIGDVVNNAAGLITSSGGTTTFFDDVTNDGEIRTNAASFTVYFGEYSGNGDTGAGTVIMEGDLKPGFSPGLTAFGGDLQFGDNASLLIELAGLLPGSEYDVVTVFDDLVLNGQLDVALLEGFTPSLNQVFDILTVGGELTGQFDGLGEGDLVGNFGGADLFITYAAGDGNDVALFTAVPEPSPLVLLGICGVTRLRRRRQQ